jgi:hypothetical protein
MLELLTVEVGPLKLLRHYLVSLVNHVEPLNMVLLVSVSVIGNLVPRLRISELRRGINGVNFTTSDLVLTLRVSLTLHHLFSSKGLRLMLLSPSRSLLLT